MSTYKSRAVLISSVKVDSWINRWNWTDLVYNKPSVFLKACLIYVLFSQTGITSEWDRNHHLSLVF